MSDGEGYALTENSSCKIALWASLRQVGGQAGFPGIGSQAFRCFFLFSLNQHFQRKQKHKDER